MKPVTLLFSTALASIMLLAPSIVPSADAAGIKIKPQIVKVRPKIAVAKPKVRVKVRAAKVRVKPKIKIKAARIKPRIKIKAARVQPRMKIKPQAPKVVASIKTKPKLRPAIQIKPRMKPKAVLLPRIGSTKTTVLIPRTKPAHQPATKLPNMQINTTAMRNLHGEKDAVQAARALATVESITALGKIGSTAALELGESKLDLARTMPSNQDRLGGMFKDPSGKGSAGMGPNGKWDNSGIGGFGPDTFVGLPNADGQDQGNTKYGTVRDAASDFLSFDTAGAIGGVAGRRDHTTEYSGGDGDVSYHAEKNMRTGIVTHTKYEDVFSRADSERHIGVIQTRQVSDSNGPIHTIVNVYYANGLMRHSTTPAIPFPGLPYDGQGEVFRPHNGAIELRDPNHVDAGGCRDMGCILGGKKAKGLTLKDHVTNSPNQVLPGSEDEHGRNRHNGPAVVSQHQLLSQYDEDGRSGDAPTQIDRSRIQSD
jgi:hypothetical protein